MEDVLYSVKDVSKLIKSNPTTVYGLIKARLLPALKLGSLKVRKVALDDFLVKYEGYDISDPSNITLLSFADEKDVL